MASDSEPCDSALLSVHKDTWPTQMSEGSDDITRREDSVDTARPVCILKDTFTKTKLTSAETEENQSRMQPLS